jgi:hypothetical protein
MHWGIFIDAIWSLSLCLPESSDSFRALADLVSEIDRRNIVSRSFLMKLLPDSLINLEIL